MSKRLLVLSLALGLVAVACSRPPVGTVNLGSGPRFVPQVADFLDNTGVDPSIAVTPDGVPYVSYFAFLEKLANGAIPPTRPIGAPSLPSVGLVSVRDGIWTRGAVAMQAQIANVTVPFSPAAVKAVKDLTADTVTGTAVAIDGQGKLHVAWSGPSGLWYADNVSGGFTAQQVVAQSVPGISLTVDSSGTPWVAYYRDKGVQVGHLVGGHHWKIQRVARAAFCSTCRTAIGATPDRGPVVAFTDAGTPSVAAQSGTWKVQPLEKGVGGEGISLAMDTQGNPHVSYYAGTQVHEAQSIAGGPWQISTVASVGPGSGTATRATTSIAVDDKGVNYVAWYDAGSDSVGLASNPGGSFAAIPTPDTRGGDSPAVSVTSDGSTAYLAWYDHVGQNLDLGTYGESSGLALANPSPTPTPAQTTGPPPSTTCQPNGTKLQLIAQSIAFNTPCLAVPAGQAFTVAFDNKDPVTHDFSIYTDSAATTALFSGLSNPNNGSSTIDYNVKPLKAGTYFFRCDFHPTQMTGTFVVK